MAGGRDLTHELRVALDLLAADEEDGRSAHPVELREDCRRPVRMRPVVEGQQHSAAGDGGRNPEHGRGARDHGGDCGRPVSGECPAGRDRERPQRLHAERPRLRSRWTEETPSPDRSIRRTAASR